jgi:hypothetical protein
MTINQCTDLASNRDEKAFPSLGVLPTRHIVQPMMILMFLVKREPANRIARKFAESTLGVLPVLGAFSWVIQTLQPQGSMTRASPSFTLAGPV